MRAAEEARSELVRLWNEHLATPFPGEWGEIEEQFGPASERTELQAVRDADELLEQWGEPDLLLYDTYVAGRISTILAKRRPGRAVLGKAGSDERLARYFELCHAEATDGETRLKVEACRSYFEQLNALLEVGRRVPAR